MDTAIPSWIEDVPIDDLTPHPDNYRQHPQDQLEHIKASIQRHGMYRNVVIANDCTILAGHGVVEAARALGYDTIPAHRLGIGPNDIRALEILTGDNEMAKLGEQDDRKLTSILKSIKDHEDGSLLGTGLDEQQLANLVYVSRSASEIEDHDAAAHWIGMPEYEDEAQIYHSKVMVTFATREDREEFAAKLGIGLPAAKNTAIWYPPRERDDRASLRFEP